MADTLKGKLIFRGEGKERKRYLVFTTRKGKTWDNPIGPDRLAPDLRDSAEAEIPVELETDPQSGQPLRVRREGQAWIESARPAQKAPARSAAGTRAGKKMPGKSGNNRRKSREQDRNNVQSDSQSMTPDFHNPYNFIPAPPRKINHAELGDKEPVGHDRYYPELYSGRLRVRMTVATPLLAPDTSRVKVTGQGKTEHKSYPVRIDADGNPRIEPTAVKGMLRSAYEAVTNSRLSVFKDHDDRLAFRGEVKMPNFAARIETYNGGMHIRRFASPPVTLVRYRKHWRGERDKLESGNIAQTPAVSGRAMRYADSGLLPRHGEPVWVKVTDRIARQGKMAGKSIGKKVDEIRSRTPGDRAPSSEFKPGWACITGANAKDKVYERVFVESPSDQFITLTDDHKAMWNELISNYQMIHEEELKRREQAGERPSDYLGNDPGQTAWSRHVFDKQSLKLQEGTLCYGIEQNGLIKALLPVMISRRLHDIPPAKLLPKESHPAQKLDELSPADRVFGWVRQPASEFHKVALTEQDRKKGAYRGQLRIGTIECSSAREEAIEEFGEPGLPLAILGQPKPQQGRFYVAADKEGNAQQDGLSVEQAGYNDLAKGLRGRKVYPHHNNLPKGYWDNPTEDRTQTTLAGHYQEYRRPREAKQETIQEKNKTVERAKRNPDGSFVLTNKEQCDNQNRSMQGWIKPGAVFGFDIHFTNLSAVELGALVWLLQLPDHAFHRFGGGKPLGFGSVRLELVREESDIRSGDELIDRYKSLDDDQPNKREVTDLVAAFKKAVWLAYGSGFKEKSAQETAEEYQKLMDEKFNEVKFIRAFLRAAQGFDDRLPIHYPRTTKTPNPEGESFKWFVANSRSTKDGVRYGYALRNLANDPGLPILGEE